MGGDAPPLAINVSFDMNDGANLSFYRAIWNLRFHFLKVGTLKTTRRTPSRNYKLGYHG